MPSLHTVGAAEGCSFHMHFHLGTNPHQRAAEITGGAPVFLFFFPSSSMVGGVCKLDPIARSYMGCNVHRVFVSYCFIRMLVSNPRNNKRKNFLDAANHCRWYDWNGTTCVMFIRKTIMSSPLVFRAFSG